MKCTSVQENLAWGRASALSKEDQIHVLSCAKCGAVAMAFEEIDSSIQSEEIDVPDNFADSIILKIRANEKMPWLEKVREIFEILSQNQAFRWGIGGTSFLIAFAAH